MILIDAERLAKDINDLPYGYRGMVQTIIYNQPTVEAIPISFIEGLIEGGQILNDLGKLDDNGKAYLSALKGLVEWWRNGLHSGD